MKKKKKTYIPTDQVRDFIAQQPEEVKAKYDELIENLENSGRLVSPYAEKIEKDLFCIRILMKNNIRVFYYYDDGDEIIGFYGMSKKTKKLSTKELKNARRLAKQTKNYFNV